MIHILPTDEFVSKARRGSYTAEFLVGNSAHAWKSRARRHRCTMKRRASVFLLQRFTHLVLHGSQLSKFTQRLFLLFLRSHRCQRSWRPHHRQSLASRAIFHGKLGICRRDEVRCAEELLLARSWHAFLHGLAGLHVVPSHVRLRFLSRPPVRLPTTFRSLSRFFRNKNSYVCRRNVLQRAARRRESATSNLSLSRSCDPTPHIHIRVFWIRCEPQRNVTAGCGTRVGNLARMARRGHDDCEAPCHDWPMQACGKMAWEVWRRSRARGPEFRRKRMQGGSVRSSNLAWSRVALRCAWPCGMS